MDINTLIDTYAVSIAENAALNAWCETTYEKAPLILVNFDKRNPPGEEGCPVVILIPVTKAVGRGVSKKQHLIEVDTVIFDESAEQDEEHPTIVKYQGVARIEAFRKLVENAIAGTKVTNTLIEAVDIEYDTIESFPFHWAGTVFTVTEQVTLGSNPLE